MKKYEGIEMKSRTLIIKLTKGRLELNKTTFGCAKRRNRNFIIKASCQFLFIGLIPVKIHSIQIKTANRINIERIQPYNYNVPDRL